MQQKRPSSTISRTSRRHDRQGGYDIADVYEARLLAQGLRTDDFILHRSTSDTPRIPDITPIRFGRGVDATPIAPIAARPEEPAPDQSSESPEA